MRYLRKKILNTFDDFKNILKTENFQFIQKIFQKVSESIKTHTTNETFEAK